MVFKRGVQLIGNCLIRLDQKSCIFTFFSKNLKNFYVARQRLKKKKKKNLKKGFQNSNTASAHLHVTRVAVYPALFPFALLQKTNFLLLIQRHWKRLEEP